MGKKKSGRMVGAGGGNGDPKGASFGKQNAREKGGSEPKLNPFERMWNRRKFDVLGKKTKGEQRKVGQSRSRAVELRKDTLLQEYRQSKKANAFVDRRFGEGDDTLAEDDKAIMRYQKERLSQLNKRSRFNLQDEDESGEGEELLMHRGLAAGVDDFDEGEVLGGEEEDDAELDAEIVDKLHFGGFEPSNGGTSADEGKPKTRKEVMEELIAKSKFYKAQKAKEKEEADELLGTLDEQFKELTQQGLLTSKPSKKGELNALMAKYGVVPEGGMDKGLANGDKKGAGDTEKGAASGGLAARVRDKIDGKGMGVKGILPRNDEKGTGDKRKSEGSKESAKGKEVGVKGNNGKGGVERKGEEKDDYEKLAREMASDLRARASDRTKDPEEAAKEERERLEKLERKRKQRMEGTEDASGEEQSDDEGGGRKAQKRRKRAEASGDDLGENFVLEGEEN